jgi:outer membrane lipoprotein-sorting protein
MKNWYGSLGLVVIALGFLSAPLQASEGGPSKAEVKAEKPAEIKKSTKTPVPKAGVNKKVAPEKKVKAHSETKEQPVPTPATAAQSAEKTLNLSDIEQLQKKLQTGNDLAVDFTQTIFRSLRKKTSKREGKGYFNKPNKFRWSLLKPSHEEWIYNGDFLAHYLVQKKSVYKYQSSAAKGKDLQHLIDMVLNFSTLFKHYELIEAKQSEGKVHMKLKPKSDGEIDSTEIVLDTLKNYVSEMKLNFRGGNYTLFTFTNPNNSELKKELFELPKDVKVEEVL